jgi:hypothetical protein
MPARLARNRAGADGAQDHATGPGVMSSACRCGAAALTGPAGTPEKLELAQVLQRCA